MSTTQLTFFAVCSHPTGLANTVAIIFATTGPILTLAQLTAIRTVITIRTRYIACGSRETGHALTLAIDVIAFAIVNALAL